MSNLDNPEFFSEPPKEIIKEISKEDLIPVVPQVEGTTIVLQCNVPDYRGSESGSVEIGELTPEAVIQARQIARQYIADTLEKIPPEERKDVSILVVGAGTKLLTETGMQSDRKRGVETAQVVLSETEDVLEEMGLSKDQIINKPRNLNGENGERRPSEVSKLQDLNFLKDSPEFTDYLKEKYGTGAKFWIAFEEMFEEEKRIEIEAEGPEQIADRVNEYLGVLANGLKFWHKRNPGKRVLVWVVAHRDNMGPFFKVKVSKTGQQAKPEDYLNIRKGGGFVIDVDPDGFDASTHIKGQDFKFQFDHKE